MDNIFCKAKCGGWKWIILGVLIGGALVFAIGCGTVSGILQDVQGAVDGIERAHRGDE